MVAAYVLAHSVLYNYIAPFLGSVGLEERVDAVLLVFGGASVLGLWLVGTLIDRHLRTLVIASSCLFALAAVVLALFAQFPALVSIGAALWGFAFGGVATLLQTAAAEAAGPAVDTGQSLFVTAWNLAIADGGVIGGTLLAGAGPEMLPRATLAIAVPAILTSALTRRNAFPGLADRQHREAAS
ncbi:MFS transporter [Streptomyces sp. NPDC001750]|uniref:MFS transporter n=1 Tax=Streptomyces sp. NPDC001750 TaxID=3364607 RepID=UPI0036B41950